MRVSAYHPPSGGITTLLAAQRASGLMGARPMRGMSGRRALRFYAPSARYRWALGRRLRGLGQDDDDGSVPDVGLPSYATSIPTDLEPTSTPAPPAGATVIPGGYAIPAMPGSIPTTDTSLYPTSASLISPGVSPSPNYAALIAQAGQTAAGVVGAGQPQILTPAPAPWISQTSLGLPNWAWLGVVAAGIVVAGTLSKRR